MVVTIRRILIISTLLAALLGFASCGGAGASGEVVARVAGVGAISKAMLDHWIPVEAVVIYQEQPTQPVPKGLIPDPPRYTACMAYLRVTPQRLGESAPKSTALELKRKCAQRLGELKVLTLNTLLDWEWTIGAGMKAGLKATDAEVRQRLERTTKTYYPKRTDFTRYLRLTGQTMSDVLFRAKVQVFEVKLVALRTELEKSVPKGLSPQQLQKTPFGKFVQDLPPSKAWAARTTCRRGYVVSACKEYKGPEAPGVPN